MWQARGKLTVWLGLLEWKACPSSSTTSSTAQPSLWAAICATFSRAFLATMDMAEPPTAMPRVAPVPPPSGTTSVSPWSTSTSKGVTPNSSATIWAKHTSEPLTVGGHTGTGNDLT